VIVHAHLTDLTKGFLLGKTSLYEKTLCTLDDLACLQLLGEARYLLFLLNQVFESTFPSLSQLADSPEEEYNRDAFICSTSKGVTYTVHGILTFISRSIGLCLQSLHHRFRDWTKPSTTSLLLGSLADLPRSKSELMAENALLRKPLIVLRRHVK